MKPALRIESVYAEQFGRWTKHGITLPDAPFVLISGPNSSGKSTMATLIEWLLSGPDDVAVKDALHLGDVPTTLKGSIEGRLGENPLSVSGSFKLNKTGKLKPTLDVNAGSHYDMETWRNLLGGVDHMVMRSVYFLWGGNLHDDTDIGHQLTQIAMGVLGGNANPRLSIRNLEEAAARSGKAKGADDESVASVNSEMAAATRHLDEAMTNADDYGRGVAEQEQLLRHIEAAGQEAARASRTVYLYDKAIENHDLHGRIHQLRDEIADLPAVSEEWASVAAESAYLKQLDELITDAQQASESSGDEARNAASELGLTVDEAASLMIFDADVTSVTKQLSELEEARRVRDEAVKSVTTSEAELARQVSATDVALDALPGVGRQQLAAARLGADELGALNRVLGETRSISGRRAEAVLKSQVCDDGHRSAEARARGARAAWERFGIGEEPEAWLAMQTRQPLAPPSIAPLNTGGDVWQSWVAVGAVLMVGLVAAGVGQWLIGVIAVVLALLVLFVLRPWKSMGRVDQTVHEAQAGGTDGSPAMHATELLLDAAQDAARAGQELERIAADAEAARADVGKHTAAFTEALRKLHETAAGFGISLPESLDTVDAAIHNWTNAVAALAEESGERTACDQATRLRQSADEREERASARLSETLEQLGVGVGLGAALGSGPSSGSVSSSGSGSSVGSGRELDPMPVADLLVKFKAAGELARRSRHESEVHSQRCEQWNRFVGSVSGEVEGWSRQRTLDHLGEVQDRIATKEERDAELRGHERELNLLTSEDDLRELVDRRLSVAELDAGLKAAEVELERRQQAQGELQQQLGSLKDRIGDLEKQSQVADIQARIGSLRERRRELAVEAAAACIASRLLGEITEEFQKENQPEVVKRTSALVTTVTPTWDSVRVQPGDNARELAVSVRQSDGAVIPSHKLSTGARGLLHLALRLSLAARDQQNRPYALPLICDDPFVHFADDWAARAVRLLEEESHHRQVLLFTCHGRTVADAKAAGATVIDIVE